MSKDESILKLLERFKKKGSAKSVANNLLTVEEVSNKYFKNVSKLHIEKYVQMMRNSDAEDFTKFFKAIVSGLKLTGRIYQGVDVGGKPYSYVKFFSPKGDVECKIFPLGKLSTMITDYQAGKFVIKFTAVDLVEHLLN
ncbi:MAG: hypothetical protein EOO89_25500, partial [Pedobacter sp.]